VWIASDAPSVLAEMQRPPVLIQPGRVTPVVRDLRLDQTLETLSVQTMGHHARSCYLGEDADGLHYFAKGIGWCLSPGWSPERGNTGVLARWAAERERDLSLALAKHGLRVPEPMAIYSYDWLPANTGQKRWPAADVPDLDGRPAGPSLYVYRYPARFRLADLPIAAPEKLSGLEGAYHDIISSLRQSICTLQAAGGHDYSLSLHNVWEDGGRVDFEYVVLGGVPHPVEQLNGNPEVWRAKEWSALRCIAFELADMVGVEVHARQLEAISTPPDGLVQVSVGQR
jgi:hypothetical protein